jgi:hypothetical protein
MLYELFQLIVLLYNKQLCLKDFFETNQGILIAIT